MAASQTALKLSFYRPDQISPGPGCHVVLKNKIAVDGAERAADGAASAWTEACHPKRMEGSKGFGCLLRT
jgi:hypothetical protein